MLIKCQECELQVSDKALSCPHCGYPMKSHVKQKVSKNNKRRRLPNGFGQISEIKNRNLRNPFRAMVTVSKTPAGRPICKPLKPESYFPTYNDAYMALVEYNKNPYDLSPSITVSELFEKWSDKHFTNISDASVRSIKNAWVYCSSVYDMRAVDLRVRHIKGCMDSGYRILNNKEHYPSANMKNQIKSLFNQMLDYAVEYEIVDKNYARTFKLSNDIINEVNTVKNSHIAFSDEEMTILWNNIDNKNYVDIMIIQCYSGWRPKEIGIIKLEDVDLVNWTFTGGIKTTAGKERLVPIHSKIRDLVLFRYNEAVSLGSDFLFNCTDVNSGKNGNKLTYERYQKGFSMICDELNLNPNHRPHDGRTHFVTQAKKYGVDEYAIKYIVGHRVSDITEKVYTKREYQWLAEEIEKIK